MSREERGSYLVVSSSVPVRDSCGVCNLLLKPVGTECAECDRGCAVDTAECPERKGHCVDVDDFQLKTVSISRGTRC